MSSFYKWTKHPRTGIPYYALWIDDCFGPHNYGVRFPVEVDAYDERDWKWEFPTADEIRSASLKKVALPDCCATCLHFEESYGVTGCVHPELSRPKRTDPYEHCALYEGL